MKKIVIILSLLLFSGNASAIAGFYCDGFSDPSPAYGEEDVPVGQKGVQTCINITVPDGCNVSVTFQWMNYSEYMWDWIWCFFFGIGCPVNYYDDEYWYDYASWDDVNSSTELCAYQENATCSIFGYWSEQDWRIVSEWNCSGELWNQTCYLYFETEECSLFSIYPNHGDYTVCPCADAMCINITNYFGNPMNITFYRNDSQFEEFYVVNQLFEVGNGTYCFCLDGHINDSVYYPMRFNETYYWYVNVTDTVFENSEESEIFMFHTAMNRSDCIAGDEPYGDIPPHGYTLGLFGLVGLIGLIWGYKRRE